MIVQGVADPDRVRETLRGVMEREGIPRPESEPNALERWLGDLFDALMGGIGSGTEFLQVLLVAVGAVFVAVLIGRFVRRRRSALGGNGVPEQLPDAVRRRVVELCELARQHAREGDLRLALREYLLALVVGLGEHGDLEFRDAWTNRELLVRGEVRPELRTRLAAMFDELDPKTFGREPVVEQDVERLDRACRGVLEGSFA